MQYLVCSVWVVRKQQLHRGNAPGHTYTVAYNVKYNCVTVCCPHQQSGGHVECGSRQETWLLWVSPCDGAVVVVLAYHQSTPTPTNKMEWSVLAWTDQPQLWWSGSTQVIGDSYSSLPILSVHSKSMHKYLRRCHRNNLPMIYRFGG